jgi:hypothetical protein
VSDPAAPPPAPPGAARVVSAANVERAADALLRQGERPTVEKIRAALGGGSPNTVNPLLDAWWKRLAGRLDAGPAALHRLPEGVAHIAESLWLQALEEGRRRAALELQTETRSAAQSKDAFEVRSHVLSLREGELDSRLKDRERALEDLQAQLRTLGVLLQKEQRTRESQSKRIEELEGELLRHRLARTTRPIKAQRPARPRAPEPRLRSKIRRGPKAAARNSQKTRKPAKRRRPR